MPLLLVDTEQTAYFLNGVQYYKNEYNVQFSDGTTSIVEEDYLFSERDNNPSGLPVYQMPYGVVSPIFSAGETVGVADYQDQFIPNIEGNISSIYNNGGYLYYMVSIQYSPLGNGVVPIPEHLLYKKVSL